MGYAKNVQSAPRYFAGLSATAGPECRASARAIFMKALPHNPDLLSLAQRVIWFEPAQQALSNPIRFLAYVMAFGTLQEIIVVRRYLDLDDFREALDHAPPGIIDKRSWAYWNTVIGRYPAPPMPTRIFPT
jgi:hypothetical protein